MDFFKCDKNIFTKYWNKITVIYVKEYKYQKKIEKNESTYLRNP